MIGEYKKTIGKITWAFDDGKIVMKLPTIVPIEIMLTNESAIQLVQEIIQAVKTNQSIPQ